MTQGKEIDLGVNSKANRVTTLRGVLGKKLPVIATPNYVLPKMTYRLNLKVDDKAALEHFKEAIISCFPKDVKIKWRSTGGIKIFCLCLVRGTPRRNRLIRKIQSAKGDILVLRWGTPPSPGRVYQLGQYEALGVRGNVHILSFVNDMNPVQQSLFAFYLSNWPLPKRLRTIFPTNQDGPFLPFFTNDS